MQKQYLCIRVDKFELAIPVLNIIEIIIADQSTDFHGQSADDPAVYSFRDLQIPLVDLSRILDEAPRNTPLGGRIIICEHGSDKAALLTDSADEILRLDDDSLSESTDSQSGIKADYLSGSISIDERIISILSIEKILRTVPTR